MDNYLWLGTGDGYLNIYQIKKADGKLIKPMANKAPVKPKLTSTTSLCTQYSNLTKKRVAFSQSSLNLLSNKQPLKKESSLSNELRIFSLKKSLNMNKLDKSNLSGRFSSVLELNEQDKVDSRVMIQNYLLSLQNHTFLSSMPELAESSGKNKIDEIPDEKQSSSGFSYSIQVSENLRHQKKLRIGSEKINNSNSEKTFEFDDINNDYISDNLWSGSSRLSYSNKDVWHTSSTSSFKDDETNDRNNDLISKK